MFKDFEIFPKKIIQGAQTFGSNFHISKTQKLIFEMVTPIENQFEKGKLRNRHFL